MKCGRKQYFLRIMNCIHIKYQRERELRMVWWTKCDTKFHNRYGIYSQNWKKQTMFCKQMKNLIVRFLFLFLFDCESARSCLCVFVQYKRNNISVVLVTTSLYHCFICLLFFFHRFFLFFYSLVGYIFVMWLKLFSIILHTHARFVYGYKIFAILFCYNVNTF